MANIGGGDGQPAIDDEIQMNSLSQRGKPGAREFPEKELRFQPRRSDEIHSG
ncbi:MAG: hypothetical protein JWO38_584 [Gemmataceae bacterium]|nr:hypothetical protein [Gemmataceae bacterium]